MVTFSDRARPPSHLRVQAAEDCVATGTDPGSRQVHVPVSLYWTLVRRVPPGPESSHLPVAGTQRICAIVLEVVASPPSPRWSHELSRLQEVVPAGWVGVRVETSQPVQSSGAQDFRGQACFLRLSTCRSHSLCILTGCRSLLTAKG